MLSTDEVPELKFDNDVTFVSCSVLQRLIKSLADESVEARLLFETNFEKGKSEAIYVVC